MAKKKDNVAEKKDNVDLTFEEPVFAEVEAGELAGDAGEGIGELPVESSPPRKTAAKLSDMQNFAKQIRERIEKDRIQINTSEPKQTQVIIGEDFVKDCSAMIPRETGQQMSPTYNFRATLRCVVPKGDNTATRLLVLKDAVRAAVSKEPIAIGSYVINTYVMDTGVEKGAGVRIGVLSIVAKVERIKTRSRTRGI